ncbi:hypothetical protein ACFC26_28030 [Kitasatospora purpeofusca]|uniref:hypothetical protein n=1 Tax=Kitasatospora purpeofusca TaxID=67352 RepID=UPI0035E233C1
MAARTRTPARRTTPAKPAAPTKPIAAPAADTVPAPRTDVDPALDQATIDALLDSARTDADQLRTAARADADQLLAQARQKVADAEERAQEVRAEAHAVLAEAERQAQSTAVELEDRLAAARDELADAVHRRTGAEQTVARLKKLTDQQIEAAEETVARVRAIADGDLAAAEQTVARRRQAAEKLQSEAEAEYDRLVAAGRERAQQIVADAEQVTEQARVEAEQVAAHAEHLVAEAKERAEHLVAVAEADAAQRREDAVRTRTEAQAEAAELREQARVEVEAAEESAVRVLEVARDKGEDLVAEAETEAEQRRAQADQVLADAREQAEEAVAEVQARAEAQAAGVLATAEQAAKQRLAGAEADARSAIGKAEQRVREVLADGARRHAAEQARLEVCRAAAEEAEALIAKQRKREDLTDRWGPKVALAAAVTLTASGEFALAKLAGWPSWVAWALPLAIDVYVVQAFRRHKDVPGAIVLMILANAVYHLAAAGLVGVVKSGPDKGHALWWLIVGVAAIAPWVMWRLHKITDTGEAGENGGGESTLATAAGENAAPTAVGFTDRRGTVSPLSPVDPFDAREPSVYETDPGENGAGENGRPMRLVESGPTAGDNASSHRESGRENGTGSALVRRGGETRKRPGNGDAAIEAEITGLHALMIRRGGKNAVSLEEAMEVTGKSQATAWRRLESARERYEQTG